MLGFDDKDVYFIMVFMAYNRRTYDTLLMNYIDDDHDRYGMNGQ